MIDFPALDQAIEAGDADAIRRLFASERALRIRIELHRDGLLNGIVLNAKAEAREVWPKAAGVGRDESEVRERTVPRKPSPPAKAKKLDHSVEIEL